MPAAVAGGWWVTTIYTCNGDIIRMPQDIAASEGCCCCASGTCRLPTEWRIVDSADSTRIFAAGPVSPDTGNLEQVPQPFTPIYYWQLGPTTYRLEVLGCNGTAWAPLTTFTMTNLMCFPPADRYPEYGWPETCWPPPPGCDCALDANGDPTDPCIPCPNLCLGLAGTGQEWRDPDHGQAATFHGGIDGEWTNLNNWADANGRTPAISLPGSSSTVTIDGDVTSKPTGYSAQAGIITINAGRNFSIEATCSTLQCYGTVARPASPVCANAYGKITCTSAATFTGGRLDGELIGDAQFLASSLVSDVGVVTGSALFDDSDNEGTVTGNGEFDNASRNKTGGVVEGNAIFRNGSVNTQATVEGDAEFYDDSANSNGTVEGNAEFYGTSTNESNANVNGTATFNDSSFNNTTANVYGAATFNGSSYNAAHCWSTAVFTGSTQNQFLVSGNATFNGGSRNNQGAFVGGDATFNDAARNAGSVNGTATFNGSSCNEATGTAGAFVPNPPPACP